MNVNALTEYKQHNDFLIEQVKEKNKEINELRQRVERYEKVLHALLPLCLQTDNDVGLDIITDSLNGFELMEQYNSLAENGKETFGEHFSI